jgi:kynurenine formamidase
LYIVHRTVIIADFSGRSLQRDEIIQADHPILQKALAATITADTVLLLKTGWSRYWGTPEYNTWPSFSASAAQAILDAGIRLVGVDTFSPDAPEGDFDAHRIWLGSGVLIVENLDLSHLEGDGWSLSVVPLRLEGLDGSPIRAFAQRL